ncbi:hypothetical protein ACIOEZ_31945 [Streptomyces sp. NPDC087866]|uniref:hypothetical protein n=1 Tax=Streptomyces sp. NPDC087866 TaxID=3365815 RepID=UPI003823B507
MPNLPSHNTRRRAVDVIAPQSPSAVPYPRPPVSRAPFREPVYRDGLSYDTADAEAGILSADEEADELGLGEP